ncbi:helix-turn-helix transcriptional regulator [Enterococcus durans]|uniref:helix-turn-helix domain-containing protein n=1 Tax=Enterococcus durans TaxID=53345 RepID=UPI00288F4AEB|nr:helix-turn-helix transcriptional regulator [Enterococcus durans]MDT2837532.1 helix-turn-helix transcriptional regulator [Enterococcus durans]
MTLFDRIKYLAKKQGKSINDIEREMGYSQNTLYRLKTTNPSSKKLQEIADHFQVSTDYLLGRTDNPNIGVAPEERKLTVEEALASVMSSDGKPLTDNDRQILTELIEAYIEKKYK